MSERDIFIGALQTDDPAERRAYLEAACGSDDALRWRVDGLLEVYARAGSFLEAPAGPPTGTAAYAPAAGETAPGPEAGVVIAGRYKLLEVIGEGGMGTVWLAEQTEPVRRKVAVKLIKPGMDSRQVLARFEAERQTLALMDHPNIAKVHDAGATPDGRPYFVMELVKGAPITKYCDDHHLTPRQRLELFVAVCQAVQHAHQKGIIHRDLKPTNVLVAPYDGTPVVKVIDFGVAKAAGQPLTEKTLFTGFGAVVGTPEYMSPEQAELNNADIDTRSDVFSLGVLLYELLTGSTPLTHKRLKEAALLEVLRLVREEEPPRPSTRLSTAEGLPSIAASRGLEPRKLSGVVRGELDWIVMRALEKDRGRRYETANGFAADIQRYLADETVQACPPSAGYRLRKFARRNTRGLATAAVLALAILAVAGTLGWAVRDRDVRAAEAARDRAARRASAEQDVGLALTEADRWQEQGRWAEALSAARRAEGLVAGVGDDLREQVGQRRRDLEMVLRVEQIRARGSAVREDRRILTRADAEYATAFREFGIDPDALSAQDAAGRLTARPGVAPALVAAVADWAFVRGEGDRAAGQRLMAVAQVADPDPWRHQVREALAGKDWASLERFARAEELLGQPPATQYLLGLALADSGNDLGLEVLRRAQRRYPGDYWINYRLGQKLVGKGAEHADEAIGYLRAAIAVRPSPEPYFQLGKGLAQRALWDEAVAAYRTAIELGGGTASTHTGLGYALEGQGKPAEAVACFRRAIELDSAAAGRHVNLGRALRKLAKLDEAVASYQKAIELDPKRGEYHSAIGLVRAQQGKLVEATALFRTAIALDPKDVAAHHNLGVALNNQGKVDEAIASYRAAIELDPKHSLAHHNLGACLQQQGKLDEAVASYRTAIALDPKGYLAYRSCGDALYMQGKLGEAIACYQRAVELKPDDLDRLNELAWLLATCPEPKYRNAARAVELGKKAVELSPESGSFWNTLGVAHYRAGDWTAAVSALHRSIELRKGGDSTDWFVLAMAHWRLGERDTARAWYDKATAWMAKNQPRNEELRRFRAEAEELMGLGGAAEVAPPPRQKK